jgi:exodeoxyribonuclease V alpha subunit
MTAPAPSFVTIAELLEGKSAELRQLYQGAAANSGLLASDYMTVGDLLDLSGYCAEEPLHVLLLILMATLDEGSLCVEITRERLQSRLAALAGPDLVGNWPERILDGLSRHGYPALLTTADHPDKPIIKYLARGEPTLPVRQGMYLYFQKLFTQERLLARLLRQRLDNRNLLPAKHDLPGILKEVLDDRPLNTGAGRLILNREQRLALALALLRPFVLVSGGPGTGKTSLVVTILRCLARLPKFDSARVALAAPTGRAAQRLTDSLRCGLETLPTSFAAADKTLESISAQTLHRLLGYMPERGLFRSHAENPLDADVVLVDEVSMIGLELMTQLFQALPAGAKLILLGDKDQLPSVDAGAVLANLSGTTERPGYRPAVRDAVTGLFPELGASLATFPATGERPLDDVLVILEQNHRSQPQIQEIARMVNAQRADLAIPARAGREVCFSDLHAQGGCFRLENTHDFACWRSVLVRWLEEQYCTERGGQPAYLTAAQQLRLPAVPVLEGTRQTTLEALFRTLTRARILTLVRDGPWGALGINQFFQQELRRRLAQPGEGRLFVGAPVLVTRNDYRRELFNGDVGLVLRTESRSYCAVFPRLGTYVSLPLEALPPHELAFAMTVHKAQGSEYDDVMLVLPPQGGQRLLTKEIVYTGLTRARQLALIASSAEVLRTAVSRRVEREANLLR